MLLTDMQKKRVTADWAGYAKESIGVEQIGGAIYAYGSELAMLRLEHKMKTGKAGWSENLKTWYYCLELKY